MPSLTSPTLATRIVLSKGQRPGRLLRSFMLFVSHPGDKRPTAFEIRGATCRIGSRKDGDIVLMDESVSRNHCEICIDDVGYRLRDLGSTNGTFVGECRIVDGYLYDGAVIRLGGCALRFELGSSEAPIAASDTDLFGPLVGSSIAMRELFSVLERAAPSNATVLVEGESGTGKELIAEAIHLHSERKGQPLVVFDCASVPANLIESELFGHERGAFTGAASRHIGRMEEANGGTLFLDELGELPLDLQPKLLRALEKREIRRVGGQSTIPIDVRVVAATHRDLVRMVNQGSFREDLFYRLAVVRVTVPSLRSRREDIPVLVRHFIRTALRSDHVRAELVISGIQQATWDKLLTHPWPGNVRELKNLIERTLVLTKQGESVQLQPDHRESLPQQGTQHSDSTVDLSRPFMDVKADWVSRFEENYLQGILAKHGGNISQAAQAAGLDRMYFKKLLKKYEP